MVAFRLGLGRIVGHTFMVLTTTGRVTRRPRRTMVVFHDVGERKYVVGPYGLRSDWYRNLCADARVTVQTASGAAAMTARRVTDPDELVRVYELLARRGWVLRPYVAAQGIGGGPAGIAAAADRLLVVAFEPTIAVTPPPLRADLAWLWPLGAVALAIALTARTRRATRAAHHRRR
jgi:deazaflavin-dependent oxidoreductase (nitroreductase family)